MASTTAGAVIERLLAAINGHDLDAFVECFAIDYQSEQPLHPDRVFTGRDQVRKNWSKIFSGIPDIEADMLRVAVAGDTVWSEWHWHGTQNGGVPWQLRGVTLFGIQHDQIVWGRLYMEGVQEGGRGIDAAMDAATQCSQGR
jgi:ketosteroid isomerase-like protein